jgi:hypothetical protein
MGCKEMSAPVRSGSTSLAARAARFAPPPGQAAIYVIRRPQLVASGAAVDVHLDQVRFGSVPPYAYLYGEIGPAQHTLELSLQVCRTKPLRHPFTVEAGRCYYFDIAVRMGGFHLEPIPEADGKKVVQKYSLSGDNRFERLLRTEQPQ